VGRVLGKPPKLAIRACGTDQCGTSTSSFALARILIVDDEIDLVTAFCRVLATGPAQPAVFGRASAGSVQSGIASVNHDLNPCALTAAWMSVCLIGPSAG
jgi:hypothetical protein